MPGKLCKICGNYFKPKGRGDRFVTCPTEECRRKNKQAINNGNWKGGKTSSRKREMSTKEYKGWRKSVFTRDNFTCVLCGKRGGPLEADHIKPWAYFPDLRYDTYNGRTLCRDCHKTTFKEVYKWRDILQ